MDGLIDRLKLLVIYFKFGSRSFNYLNIPTSKSITSIPLHLFSIAINHNLPSEPTSCFLSSPQCRHQRPPTSATPTMPCEGRTPSTRGSPESFEADLCRTSARGAPDDLKDLNPLQQRHLWCFLMFTDRRGGGA